MSKELILIGFFDEIVELCIDCGYKIYGYVDMEQNNSGFLYLGNDDEFLKKKDSYKDYKLFLVTDQPLMREKLYHMYHEEGFVFESLVSPKAIVSSSAEIGEGAMIQAGCNVSTNVSIGKCARVNSMANCMHDSLVDDFCVIAPSAVMLGYTKLKKNSYLGANATMLPHTSVENACVGAGAVVTKDVCGETVVGVPARKMLV